MTSRIIYIILIVLGCEVSFSQNYFPFPDSNATWCDERFDNGFPVHYFYYYYKTDGKTTINDTIYTIISDNYDSINCYLREENKKVYCRTSPDLTEFVLYDFNINIGDTIFLYGEYPWYVISSDSLLIGSEYHKRYYLHGEYGPFIHFIEGVGSDIGLMYYNVPLFDIWSDLYCFSLNDTIYETDGSGGTYTGNCWIYIEIPEYQKIQMDIFPNPSSDKIFLKYENECDLELTDMFGSVVRKSFTKSMDIHDLTAGIYILNIYSETGLLMNRVKIIR